ncbi:flagellar biosynthetic protein FliO [Vreelandella subglaciescola]|jgi:flagellar protein FliO/FliZ|uniref:Flagellar protein n=1 Tax=Vreelandella subglaciescola TaxID=29571 RepID=A0A1M7HFC4_9GAMM|nr:flagellar biosynthetic protein FliO [Halomonas subglaciescola]SHM27185.1 flagellar protein FliO/FliZ [Halomonas subglaciescola]
MSADTASSDTLNAVGSSDALLGMAALGKTAAALAFVIALILVCTVLLKRFNKRQAKHGAHLEVISSTAVGTRERVVIVELDGTWLVLGVGNGRVNKLHERPAPAQTPHSAPPPASGFSARFAQALRQSGHASRPADPGSPRSTTHTSL